MDTVTVCQQCNIIDFLPDATFVIDRHGRVRAWNRAMEVLSGVAAQDILGKGDYEYALPFFGERRPMLIDRALDSNQEQEVEGYFFVRQDQEGLVAEGFVKKMQAYLWAKATPLYDHLGYLVGAIESIRDVTERRKSQQKLLASEARFRLLAEHVQDVVYYLSLKPKLEFDYISPSIEALTGYPADVVKRNPRLLLDRFLPPKTPPFSRLQAGEMIPKEIYRWQRPDGQEVWLEHQAVPVHDARGRVLALEGILRDITTRRLFEQEMSRLDRLNLVGQMAASIAHEIRNPMTTVRGFLQLLAENPQPECHSTYYELMIEELDRANCILTEFLSLTRNRHIDLQPHDLNKIISSLAPLLLADAKIGDKTIELDLGEIPPAALDEEEIRQLLVNLVRNGLEAMAAGGQLTIRTECQQEQLVLTVQDQGPGIPPELLPKIGTPFFTTKAGGTGLGLAVCYSIAARHNALIEVSSDSAGTAFLVRFPALPGERISPEPDFPAAI